MCGPCEVWVSLDNRVDLERYHTSGSRRHPLDDRSVKKFNEFLSGKSFIEFQLHSESYMCDVCYRGCTRVKTRGGRGTVAICCLS